MRGVWQAAVLLLVLGACSGREEASTPVAPESRLERAAIAAGLVEDPATIDVTGLYARDTDRLCIVPARSGYRVGAFVDYGDGQSCAASGTATREGATLHIELGGASGCSLEASYEADRIAFPGTLPERCEALCTRRASLAALQVERLSASEAEAATMRDDKGRLLCGS